MNKLRQGEIFFTDLKSNRGSEQTSFHPVVIVSNNSFNSRNSFVLVATITAVKKRQIPTHVGIDKEGTGLPKDSFVLCEQIHIINKNKIHKVVGKVNKKDMTAITRALKISVGMGKQKEVVDCPVQRGDVFNTEIGLMLIVQNNVGNKHSTTTIGIHVHFKELNNQNIDNLTVHQRIQTIDKERFGDKIGQVSAEKMESINKMFYKFF